MEEAKIRPQFPKVENTNLISVEETEGPDVFGG